MSRHIAVRIEKCVGCHTCELACAITHSQTGDIEAMMVAGERPGYRIHVETYGPRAVPLSCQHCEEAACALACPTGAVKRLAAGKPVLVDDSRCVGCTMCVHACPFGVMAMRPDGKVAFKCDLCIHRTAKGEEPACAASCPTGALYVTGDDETVNRDKRQMAVERLVTAQEAGVGEVEALGR
jgi:carbon-monoxide dehydrogenase iron sulfur subunit